MEIESKIKEDIRTSVRNILVLERDSKMRKTKFLKLVIDYYNNCALRSEFSLVVMLFLIVIDYVVNYNCFN